MDKSQRHKKSNNKIDYNLLVDRPCFITGHPRSGTNLLNKLLDGQNVLSAPGLGKMHALRKLVHIEWSRMKKNEIFDCLNKFLEYYLDIKTRKLFVYKIKPYLFDYSTFREVIIAILKGTVDHVNHETSEAKIWTEKNNRYNQNCRLIL